MISSQEDNKSHNFEVFYRSAQKSINCSKNTKYKNIHLDDLHQLIINNKDWINKVGSKTDIVIRKNQLLTLFNKISSTFKSESLGALLANEVKAIAQATSLFDPEKKIENPENNAASSPVIPAAPVDQTVTFITNAPIKSLPKLDKKKLTPTNAVKAKTQATSLFDPKKKIENLENKAAIANAPPKSFCDLHILKPSNNSEPYIVLPNPWLDEKKLTLTMKKPSELRAKYFKSGDRSDVVYHKAPMGEQVFWLHPFWMDLKEFQHETVAKAFGVSVKKFLKELHKIIVLKDVTNEELKVYLENYPQIQYLVVKSSRVTEFPAMKLNLKMLCVNECENLTHLPLDCVNLKALYCRKTSLTQIPESYTDLEVLECAYTNVYVPNLPSLKIINAEGCKNLNISLLKNIEAVICNTDQKNSANANGARLVNYDKSSFYPPKALQHKMKSYTKDNLYINYQEKNPLIKQFIS